MPVQRGTGFTPQRSGSASSKPEGESRQDGLSRRKSSTRQHAREHDHKLQRSIFASHRRNRKYTPPIRGGAGYGRSTRHGMPGSPKRTRPDCPYSASQLDLIHLQDDRIALGLGILSEVEIVQLTPQELSDTIEIYRRYVLDANLRACLEDEIDSLYQDGSIS